MIVTQVQSSMVHGSRLTDKNCDPAAGEIPLSAGNCEPDDLSYIFFSFLPTSFH